MLTLARRRTALVSLQIKQTLYVSLLLESRNPTWNRSISSSSSGELTSPSYVSKNAGKTPYLKRNSDRLLVIGSGVAGSATALIAAELYKIPTTILFSGSQPTDCNSYWAQGGIIYRGRPGEDSPGSLAKDIHRAGAGLCYDPAVQKLAHEGPDRVDQLLLDMTKRFANVPFQRASNTGELSLTLGM